MKKKKRAHAAKGNKAPGTINDRIRFLLKTVFGDNQTQMAEAIGIAQPVISRVVTGKQNPGGRLVEALASHPKVNPQWLHSGLGDPLLAERGPATSAGWPIPVATALLPGEPNDYPDLLSTRTEYVPGIIYRESVYAVEASTCSPAIFEEEEKMLPNDLVVVDADVKRWRRNVQLLDTKLCVIVRDLDEYSQISLRRVVVTSTDSTRPRIRTRTEEGLEERRTMQEAANQQKQKYRREFRGITLPGAAESFSASDFTTLPLTNVVGVAVQLIRAL